MVLFLCLSCIRSRLQQASMFSWSLCPVLRFVLQHIVGILYVCVCVHRPRAFTEYYSFTPLTYWDQHYTVCRDCIPNFLEQVVGKILNTGKYLNAVCLCGQSPLGATVKFFGLQATFWVAGCFGLHVNSWLLLMWCFTNRVLRHFCEWRGVSVCHGAGYNVSSPDAVSIVYTLKERRYVEQVECAYHYASRYLLQLLTTEHQLMAHIG